MKGLTYNGYHSYNDFGLYMRSEDRSMLPSLRKRQLVIPGRHGTYDFGDNTYDARIISVKFAYSEANLNQLRLKARAVAAWLSGEGQLIFDDEPDKYYLAKVYASVKINDKAYTAEFSVQFECQPMANYIVSTGEDLTWDTDLIWDTDITWNTNQDFTFQVTSSPTTIEFENFGLIETGLESQIKSKLNIEITGSFTTFSIAMNGKTINYNEAISNQTVLINNTDATVKIGSTNKLPVCTGDLDSFLQVVPGINTATITGTGLNCSVLFDFRPQYI